jgi:hypothetical protein
VTVHGYRVIIDIYADPGPALPDPNGHIPSPSERVWRQILDVLNAAGIDLCCTAHVGPLMQAVNMETGETRWVTNVTRLEPQEIRHG